MYLGTRRIRSAGRNSGSIEITLPALLQDLEGIPCRLAVRDGPRPEIVLQPDLASVYHLFNELWQRVCLALGEIGDLPDFSLADFSLAFFPPQHWQERPPLAYADALIIMHRQERSSQGRNGSRQGVEDSLARLLACLVVSAGYHFGLQGKYALAFGDAVAYLMTGTPTGLGTDFERGMAHRLFWGESSQQQFSSPFDDQGLKQAQPAFHRVYDQFCNWQNTPAACTTARDHWYRALTVELKSL
jgi:hypothetical protein